MPAIATQTVLLPGDEVPSTDLPIPRSSSASLKLGPGLVHSPPSTIRANVAGTLYADQKKHAVWVENNTGRVCLIFCSCLALCQTLIIGLFLT